MYVQSKHWIVLITLIWMIRDWSMQKTKDKMIKVEEKLSLKLCSVKIFIEWYWLSVIWMVRDWSAKKKARVYEKSLWNCGPSIPKHNKKRDKAVKVEYLSLPCVNRWYEQQASDQRLCPHFPLEENSFALMTIKRRSTSFGICQHQLRLNVKQCTAFKHLAELLTCWLDSNGWLHVLFQALIP